MNGFVPDANCFVAADDVFHTINTDTDGRSGYKEACEIGRVRGGGDEGPE